MTPRQMELHLQSAFKQGAIDGERHDKLTDDEKDACRLASVAFKNARNHWGIGWAMLSPHQRREAVSHAVVLLMLGFAELERIRGSKIVLIGRLALAAVSSC